MDWFGFSEGFYCGHEVQLNYLHLPKDLKQPNVKLDVLHEEDDLHLPIDISENINEILSWIMASFPRPALFNKTYPDVQFVCSRLELDNIMSSAYLHDPRFRYHDQNGFIISAVRLRGKIYLSTFYTNEEKLSRQIKHITLDLPQSSIAGLMFHKSVFSDVQDKEPDVNTAFDRKRVELFAVEILKTGTHSVLMQNKFKAVRSEDDLKELQEFKMFDVKTGFKPHKLYNLFRKWLRCFSGNMSSMIMGIKDSQCLKIKEIEEYTEDALLQMCQELYVSQIPALERSGVTLHPRREVCVSQAKRFLNLVSTIITADTPEDTVYTFSFDPEYPGKFDCFKLVGPASNHYRFISKDYYNWLNTQKLLK
ncbi:Hypothetical predicted protein [Cloeon dipterum]|uniref:Decapping nuclease n=1 Tax=Cloeon dipterum TaxID=197152 RepID=A0A8S1BK86_9INSE|nr:Hypothetical predicted protein [Cloeon dipterum]